MKVHKLNSSSTKFYKTFQNPIRYMRNNITYFTSVVLRNLAASQSDGKVIELRNASKKAKKKKS